MHERLLIDRQREIRNTEIESDTPSSRILYEVTGTWVMDTLVTNVSVSERAFS